MSQQSTRPITGTASDSEIREYLEKKEKERQQLIKKREEKQKALEAERKKLRQLNGRISAEKRRERNARLFLFGLVFESLMFQGRLGAAMQDKKILRVDKDWLKQNAKNYFTRPGDLAKIVKFCEEFAIHKVSYVERQKKVKEKAVTG